MISSRPSNYIDAFRIIAAIALVFCHSDYLHLYLNTEKIFIFNFLSYWPLVFFYTITAYFSLKSNLENSDWHKRIFRVFSLLRLIFLFSLLHEIPRFIAFILGRAPNYSPFQLLITGKNLLNIIFSLFDPIRSGNNTNVFFLFDIIIIYALSILISITCKAIKNQWLIYISLVIILFFTIIINTDECQKICSYLLLDFRCPLIPILAGYIFALKGFTFFNNKLFSSKTLIILLLLPILSTNLLYIYLPKEINRKIILILFSFCVLFFGEKIPNENRFIWFNNLSKLGRLYSLPIYLIHPLIINYCLDYIVPIFYKLIGISYPSIIIYFTIIFFGIIFSWLTSVYLIKKYPSVFKIS